MKDTLIRSSFLKWKDLFISNREKDIAFFKAGGWGSKPTLPLSPYEKTVLNQKLEPITEDINGLNKMDATVINVRQQKYDGENNIRYCAAEFKYQNVPERLQNLDLASFLTRCSRGGQLQA